MRAPNLPSQSSQLVCWALTNLLLILVLSFAVQPLAYALEGGDKDPILSELSENKDEAIFQIVRRSYRQAGLLAKLDAHKETYKAQLDKLQGEFKILYSNEAEADPLNLFWVELNKGLLPAVDAEDEKAAARSFLKLSKLYQDCCLLPTREGGAATVHSGRDFSNVELNALQADVIADPKEKPSDHTLTYIIIALGVSGLCVALIAVFYAVYRLRRNRHPQHHLEGVAKPLYLQDEQSKAHANLDEIMGEFRATLMALGQPTIKNDQLYFGDYLIDGDTRLVDELETKFGCFATIFMKDKRVATNIITAEGERALGTVLDEGPRYDTLMKDKKSFAGEVELFEDKILALYEPVVVEAEVIALLFVGIRLHEEEEAE